jgi:flagellar hook assembly protein FlgD
VKSLSVDGDIIRLNWDLANDAGNTVKDGAYTWTLRAKDDWGNAGTSASGSFTLDATPPESAASQHSTAGLDGWKVSPVDVAISATDALSGVRSISYRIEGGAVKAYSGGLTITRNGSTTLDYRATDKAGIREPWEHLTLRIDTHGPTISVAPSGPAGDAPGTWRGPVTLKPTISDATSGVAGKLVSIDGGAAKALTTATVEIAKDGGHVVAFTATDAAGNQSTTSVSLRIDSVAPVVTPGDHGDTPRTVTPNGDTVGETVAVPFTVSEASTITATVAGPDGATVRTLSTTATAAGGVSWDGRTATGKPVPDGRYTVTLRARDTAGNVGDPVAVDVDVYAALASLTRSPAQLFPQDGDALARSSTIAFRLLSRATVGVRVLDASGTVVRTAFADRALPTGPQHWTWNGKVAGGAYASPGTYRIVVAATNGTQRAAQSTSVLADAFRLEASVTGAVRGHAFQLTARSTEPLSTSPVVVVREAGVAPWTVAMTKAASGTWTATITPKRAGSAGTLGLTVKARDQAGGRNASTVRIGLQ